MNNFKIPDWVKTQLLEGEQVVLRLSQGAYNYYATDRRFLRFKSKSECDALPYDGLSVTFNRYGRGADVIRYIAISLCIFIIWIAIFQHGNAVDPTAVDEWYRYTGKVPTPLAILFGVLAALGIPWAFHTRYGYYQIDSPNLNRGPKDWRIIRNRWRNQKIDDFTQSVAERCGKIVD
ncbi:MAG: hypothetical protein JSV77_09010 [Dehalococcoidales bacterium]|nr:MAG: hypothetical protein JSV77_09010 [Dehalococcoidales bacterium]